jgi:cytochrome c oxidase subunit II
LNSYWFPKPSPKNSQRLFWGIVITGSAAACSNPGTQSVLHPAGPAAEEILWLWWFMFAVGGAVFLLVTTFALFAVFRKKAPGKDRPPLGINGFVVTGGIVVPAIILFVLLVFALRSTIALRLPETGLTIEVIGHQWWWEVRYPEYDIVTANEIYIPVGEAVRLELLAEDVIHSFWVPALGAKRDLLPDHVNVYWIEAGEAGVFRGQCAEYCGLQHARMAFFVAALPPAEFEDWVDARRQPPSRPTDENLRRGETVYVDAGCANCHAIRGLTDDVRIGPDLSDIGARLSLGAGTLPNTRADLMGWITNPQALKPGVRMPRTFLPPDELHALVDYLESLQ